MASTRVSIIFPYRVPDGDHDIFDRLIDIIKHTNKNNKKRLNTSDKPPVLVVNQDTIRKGTYERFARYVNDRGTVNLDQEVDLLNAWAVDTCQMWLAGFGQVIEDDDRSREDDLCILQIPGDLKHIDHFEKFIDELENMRLHIEDGDDLVVGDFDVTPFGSKHIIDVYGTYPMLYNWFPRVAEAILKTKKILRPRSEFIALKRTFLDFALTKRKFAYEQTIAFLIYGLTDDQPWEITKRDLGAIKDYDESRGFREANDQLERTERMLKLLWREQNGGDRFSVNEFERLERRSTAVRDAAVVSFRNFLGARNEFDSLSRHSNMKVAGSEIRWASFRGFSVLFDNPDGNLLQLNNQKLGLIKEQLEKTPSLALYLGLDKAMTTIERRYPLYDYFFFRLPACSFHVTVWDGINDGNIEHVDAGSRSTWNSLLDGLPDSILEKSEFLEAVRMQLAILRAFEISFRFKCVSILTNEVLVAELEPSPGSEQAFDDIVTARNNLYRHFKQRNWLNITPVPYQPHVTLGYFGDSRRSKKLDESLLEEWTTIFTELTAIDQITYKSISIYGFDNMVSYFKEMKSENRISFRKYEPNEFPHES